MKILYVEKANQLLYQQKYIIFFNMNTKFLFQFWKIFYKKKYF